MKKIILSICILVAATVAVAQTKLPYIHTQWPQAIDSISNDVTALAGGSYKRENTTIEKTAGVASVSCKDNKTDRLIDITIWRTIVGGDTDMGIKGKEVVSRLNITGLFLDVFPIYQRLFDPTAKLETIKANGVAFTNTTLVDGKKYHATFSRESGNGIWLLTLKD